MATRWIILVLLLLQPVAADSLSVSGLGFHPNATKQAFLYGNGTGNVTLVGPSGNSTLPLLLPTDNAGNPVQCQGNQTCRVANFSHITQAGTYRLVKENLSSLQFNISANRYQSAMPLFLSFFDATRQQSSTFHADLHGSLEPAMPYMADGSFILESHQAALPLIRLGSAYRRNPSLLSADEQVIVAPGKPDLAEHIVLLAQYLRGLQGLVIQERTDGIGFRLSTGMHIDNAFVPGPTNLTTLDVHIPGSPPSFLESVPVTSLCGADDNSSAWDACMADAAVFYRCQADEPCLNMSYTDTTGIVIGSDVGFGVSRGWGYEFGCFNDISLSQPRYAASNPCLIFYPEHGRNGTAEALLGFMEALPAIQDVNASLASHFLGRSIATAAYIKSTYPAFSGQSDDAAAYGAALFLLFNATGNASYLQEAYALRNNVPSVLLSDQTRGREYYWEEYVRHKAAIQSAGLPYLLSGQDPVEKYRGKMYYDFKDRGDLSLSRNGERVYLFAPDVRFSNSRFILTEGLLAAKTASLLPAPEQFILQTADGQLAWLTGMNSVQEGVALNATTRSFSFVFGIPPFPTEQHTRLLVDTNFTTLSSGAVTGARGTGLQFFNGTDYVFLDGRFSILGHELGTLGNGYQNESKVLPFRRNQSYQNGLSYIPGWINGPFDTDDGGEIDKIFNYRDDLDTYEYTESTNEIVATAIELLAYLDARRNFLPPHPGVNVTPELVLSSALTCYSSVQSLPATCSAGPFSTDSFSGCRTLACSGKQVLACDKGTFFEMYNQGGPGSVEICLGGVCMDDEGFVKSPDFPICLSSSPPANATLTVIKVVVNDNNGTLNVSDFSLFVDALAVTTNLSISLAPGSYVVSETGNANYSASFSGACAADGSVTLAAGENKTCVITNDDIDPAGLSCFSHVDAIPATCSGNITSDTGSGCRTIVCSGKQILACDKGTFFEMYNQGGPSSVEVCLAETCVSDNGYAKSPDYPVCMGNITIPVCGDGLVESPEECDDNNTVSGDGCSATCMVEVPPPVCGNGLVEFPEECDDNNTVSGDGCSATCMVEGNVSVVLSIAPWFPQGNNVVLQCVASGFMPSQYDWFFGDGQKQLFGSQNNVWHTYPGPGNYSATCIASDATTQENATLSFLI